MTTPPTPESVPSSDLAFEAFIRRHGLEDTFTPNPNSQRVEPTEDEIDAARCLHKVTSALQECGIASSREDEYTNKLIHALAELALDSHSDLAIEYLKRRYGSRKIAYAICLSANLRGDELIAWSTATGSIFDGEPFADKPGSPDYRIIAAWEVATLAESHIRYQLEPYDEGNLLDNDFVTAVNNQAFIIASRPDNGDYVQNLIPQNSYPDGAIQVILGSLRDAYRAFVLMEPPKPVPKVPEN